MMYCLSVIEVSALLPVSNSHIIPINPFQFCVHLEFDQQTMARYAYRDKEDNTRDDSEVYS